MLQNMSAIMFSMKDKLDISLGVSIGSSRQIYTTLKLDVCMNRCSKSSARAIGRYFKLFQRAAYPLLSHSCCKFHCSRGPNKCVQE
ncbi:hypothetical protein MKW98_030716 [Papaver atlanticum]|uniref:Uncharacterized protein n=1 Tax=Papaver atlanticum TaxID=357466 RepID=A0AAD4X2P5_9MAGN|nr:hypothetical protein MKW98_030716 [Papaver atlanticum]